MRFVVDANITASAGNSEEFPISKNSRDILNEIEKSKDSKILMCEKLAGEYARHFSNIGRTWYTRMLTRGRVDFLSVDTTVIDAEIDAIRDATQNQRDDAKKDTHLLILAENDKIIFSIEQNSRRIFVRFKKEINYSPGIIWISPVTEMQECLCICQSNTTSTSYILKG